MTMAATSGSGACVSCTISGLASTKISAAKASARAQAPRARTANAKMVSAAPMAIALHSRSSGMCGAKSMLVAHLPSRSSSAGACTWSVL